MTRLDPLGRHRFALSVTLLTLAAAPASGQASFDVDGAGTGYYLGGDSVGTLPYHRAVMGDVFGDGLNDAFFLRDTEVDGRFSPGFLDSHMTNVFEADVTDFDASTDNGKWRLFGVNATGLVSTRWDRAAHDWAHTPEYTLGAWPNAKHVRAFSLGPTRRPLIYGVMQNGTDIRVLIPVTGGYLDRPILTAPGPILGIEDVVYDPASGTIPELAVLCADGLRVYRGTWSGNNGLPIDTVLTPAATGSRSLVLGRSSSGGTAWVAWLYDTQSSTDPTLTVKEFGSAAITIALDQNLPSGAPLRVGTIAAGDLDNDGDTDILATNRDHASLLALVNTGTATGAPVFAWNTNDVRGHDLGPSGAPFGDDQLFVGDLDNDSDPDFGTANSADMTVFLLKSSSVSHEDRTPQIQVFEDDPATPLNEEAPEFFVTEQLKSQFTHVLPTVVPAGTTHLQLQLWKKVNATTPLESGRLAVKYYPLAELTGGPTLLEMNLAPYLATVPIQGTVNPFGEIMFIAMRYVERDSNGDVLRVFPGKIYAFEGATPVGQDPSPGKQWLAETWVARDGQDLDLRLANDPFPQGGDGAGSCGTTGGECLPGDCDDPKDDEGGDDQSGG